MLKFELIQCDERFRGIREPWQALWLKSGASVFQSHHWISEWYRHAPSNCNLLIAVLWKNEVELVAAVPCAVYRRWGLRLMEWAAQHYSDYCDALGDPVSVKACWTALLNARKHDIVRLKNVRSDAAVVALLQHGPSTTTDVETCLLLRSVWRSGDAWMQAQYPKKRNNYSRGRRKLEEMGRVEVEFHATPPDGAVERLRELKLEWAKRNGLSAPLVEDEHLLGGLVKAMSSLRRLLLVIVRCNDEIVAGSINATDNSRLLSWFTVYDPKYDRASPGIILLTECTRWAFDHGFTEHDHLRGMDAYKKPFANASIVLRGYTGAATAKGRVALMLRDLGIALGAVGRPDPELPSKPRRPKLAGDVSEEVV